ncbi:hypothetical protein CAOG_08745 [Capsaspora owczarzaki ATCC 30864]|uniref:hypothetical protein n=1 Tax=Capsaspora owczarzaki (strain ATCC 30864) TaxID=595528 RepID=UPI0003523A6C|nr:hypothetical protein CAOG_08745 [Capsaspora owczarzaki ATCC 30864]|eukprot:XP_011270375.1 hypothetical protein CAOG_08745 [Capsaspora owczarzaki ATCC 30864]
MIVGGDFNLCLSNQRNYLSSSTHPPPLDPAQRFFANLTSRLNLSESWTECHGNKHLYTWSPTGNSPGSSRRIDYIFTNDAFPFTPVSFEAKETRSDHRALIAAFHHVDHQHRPPPFRLNSRLLTDQRLLDFVHTCIDQLNESIRLSKDHAPLAWDIFKSRVVRYASSLGAYVAKCNRIDEEACHHLITHVECLMQDPLLTADQLKRLQDARSGAVAELQEIARTKAEGARLRSHHLSCALTERCTKVFFSLERECIKAQTIAKLTVNGEDFTTPNDIASVLHDFYSKLYDSEPIDEAALSEVLAQANPARKLSRAEQKSLGADLNPYEIAVAIENTAPDKSPGPDGLTGAFYRTFQARLCYALSHVVLHDFYSKLYDSEPIDEAALSEVLAQANPEQKSLGADLNPYEIAVAIENTAPDKSPGPDGLTGTPGRTIDANIHLMRDLLDLCRVCNIPGVAVLLDSEKAFDRVDHQFLFQALRKYGVGESFISWMELLNTGCQSRVVYNCTISLPFPIKRSVRQGSVEAPFLYAIYAGVISDYVIHKLRDKMLSLALRSGPQIVEPSLFADDTSIFLSDPNHIHALFEVYATVGRATNLKINEAKTSVLRLGPLRDADPPDGLAHLQWVPSGLESLACNSATAILPKPTSSPASQGRALSIAGRVLIANAIGLSRVWYHCRFIHMPNTYSKALSDTVNKYLWKGRFSPVARKVVTAPPKTIMFGLGLIDLPTNIAATAAQALINFLSPVPSFWKLVVNHLAEVADRPARLSDNPVAEYTAMQRLVAKFPFRLSLSVFWHHAFRAWRRLLPFSEPPRSKNELLATPLWRNPMLDKIDFWMLRKHGISYLHHLHSGKKWQSARDLREFYDSRLPQVEARLQVIRSKVSLIDPSKLRNAPVRFRENDWVVDSWGFLRRILETPAADALSVRVKPYVFRLHGQVVVPKHILSARLPLAELTPAVVSDWTSPSAKPHTKKSDLLMQLAEAYPPPKHP